jgi:hypothetical protein
MIGTLGVQLPCCGGHKGASLVVRHKGAQFKHKFAQVGTEVGMTSTRCVPFTKQVDTLRLFCCACSFGHALSMLCCFSHVVWHVRHARYAAAVLQQLHATQRSGTANRVLCCG